MEERDATVKATSQIFQSEALRHLEHDEVLARLTVGEDPGDQRVAGLGRPEADAEVGTGDGVEPLTDLAGAAPAACRFITPAALLLSYRSNGPAWC